MPWFGHFGHCPQKAILNRYDHVYISFRRKWSIAKHAAVTNPRLPLLVTMARKWKRVYRVLTKPNPSASVNMVDGKINVRTAERATVNTVNRNINAKTAERATANMVNGKIDAKTVVLATANMVDWKINVRTAVLATANMVDWKVNAKIAALDDVNTIKFHTVATHVINPSTHSIGVNCA